MLKMVRNLNKGIEHKKKTIKLKLVYWETKTNHIDQISLVWIQSESNFLLRKQIKNLPISFERKAVLTFTNENNFCIHRSDTRSICCETLNGTDLFIQCSSCLR